VAPLSLGFGCVGTEFHPESANLCACTGNDLYSVDRVTGEATETGELSPNQRNNLAAPYTKITSPGWSAAP
jgi:hypothetical protein